jgi:hypothetical protein
MFRIRAESDRAKLAVLLDESQLSLAVASGALLLAILAGIVAAVMQNWFSQLWPWVAIVVLIVVSGLMTPLAANPMTRVRQSLGMPSRADRKGEPPPAPGSDAEVAAVRARLRPAEVAAVGILGIAILVWLMVAKPF